jgi:GT2 family glycosyltransferase
MQKIVLSHNSSLDYTKAFMKSTNDIFTVYDSSKAKTQFTQSFNNCLKSISEEWIMICNNDIDLNAYDTLEIERLLRMKPAGIYSPIVNSPHPQMYKAGEVNWVELVIPIIHKKVIDRIGYLDEDMIRGWGVDMDYCYRAKKWGFNIEILPTRAIKHYEHKSIGNIPDYVDKASSEMNTFLKNKYGANWKKILDYRI